MFNLRVPHIRWTSERNVICEPRLPPHLFARSRASSCILSRESLSFSHEWIGTELTGVRLLFHERARANRKRIRTQVGTALQNRPLPLARSSAGWLTGTLRAPLSRGEKRLWKIIQRRYSHPARTFRGSVIRLFSTSNDAQATSR